MQTTQYVQEVANTMDETIATPSAQEASESTSNNRSNGNNAFHKKELEKQLWNIANTLRGNMSADEFRDYILGFIFYKYLSDKLSRYADSVLAPDGITYDQLNPKSNAFGGYDQDTLNELLEAVKEESIDALGFFLKPEELFHTLAKEGEGGAFIIEPLNDVLRHIEQSTMGQDSEDDFNGLFDELDLSSNKLGKTEKAKNELVSKILSHLDAIDFHLDDAEIDVLGDAYEYLIGQFASGAGKKAGEFYIRSSSFFPSQCHLKLAA